jgi:NTP pyrophosphatase (non-canonical NTP hydrolase)
MSKLNLPASPTLQQFQTYLEEMAKERGFNKETLVEAFILFTEEVGEFARIVRKSGGMKTDVAAQKSSAADELADLFIYILHMANILGVDLETAFREKEEQNKRRTWK